MNITLSTQVSILSDDILNPAIEKLTNLEGLSDNSIIMLDGNMMAMETSPNSFFIKTINE